MYPNSDCILICDLLRPKLFNSPHRSICHLFMNLWFFFIFFLRLNILPSIVSIELLHILWRMYVDDAVRSALLYIYNLYPTTCTTYPTYVVVSRESWHQFVLIKLRPFNSFRVSNRRSEEICRPTESEWVECVSLCVCVHDVIALVIVCPFLVSVYRCIRFN